MDAPRTEGGCRPERGALCGGCWRMLSLGALRVRGMGAEWVGSELFVRLWPASQWRDCALLARSLAIMIHSQSE